MNESTSDDTDRTRRFRDAALPCLDDAYTLARYLLRNDSDAEDAVQECYLRALQHFDSYRGPAIRPWLFAILRNICQAEFARRAKAPISEAAASPVGEPAPLWQEPQDCPESGALRHRDAASVQRLIALLPEPFREVLVLRDLQGLSYRGIADVVRAPVGTVMSRLARARTMLRHAWMEEEQRG